VGSWRNQPCPWNDPFDQIFLDIPFQNGNVRRAFASQPSWIDPVKEIEMRELCETMDEAAPGPQTTPLCENAPPRFAAEACDGWATLPGCGDHRLERDVRRRLEELSGVHFNSLVVRRIPNGVCLQGHALIEDEGLDLNSTVREVDGVDQVLNRLVMMRHVVPPR